MKPWVLLLSLSPVGAGLIWLTADWWIAVPEGETAHYVGRETCARCHEPETKKWIGSDHDLAMDLATPEFVLGDFDNTELTHYGVTSRMYRRGDEFFVETDGPDGKMAEFKVKYVFGVRPLQQYLAELDRGYVQVLPVTWDTENKEWFFCTPDDPFGPDDPLHWTGSAQNWNHMCADCHTTNFAKNYDVETDTYHYSFSEIDVSCETCHGPGSVHVELAESNSIFWDRRRGYGLADLTQEDPKALLESCAPCHAHRQRVYPGWQPGHDFEDHFGLTLLEDHLYHADGQIDEEVYVFGSFEQSRMYRKGVRCTDCHDPHTARVKSGGNALCTQCHKSVVYDTPKHHFHEVGSKGAECVECHMPDKVYMVVDPRRDHSLRIPRPDLTVKWGIPNACNDCHTEEAKPEETPQWAADKIVEWYGPKRRYDPHYGEIFGAARRGRIEVERPLAKLIESQDVGPIVRATATSLLATRYNTRFSRTTVRKALGAPEAIVRAAALRAFDGWHVESPEEMQELQRFVVPLLSDPVRLVRSEAVRRVAPIALRGLNEKSLIAFERAFEELKTGLLTDGDQSGSHMSLGILYDQLGQPDKSVREYRRAISLDPGVSGPRSNLVQLLERLGNHTDEIKQLRIVEAKLLARDARLLPNNAPIHYRLGLLQYLLGRNEEAIAALSHACELEPNSADYLMALTLLYEKLERWDAALRAAKRLVRLRSNNAVYQQILQRVERGAAGGTR